jgi:two-component system, NarL family, sensor histidine kinase UhpB
MTTPSAPAARSIDLKHALLWRVTLFAAGLFLVASLATVVAARQRIEDGIGRTGSTIRQLIADAATRSTTAFDRNLVGMDLSGLDALGRLLPFCATVDDIYGRRAAAACFTGEEEAATHPAAGLLAALVGPAAVYRGGIGIDPGIKIAELTVRPNFDSEAASLARQILHLAVLTAGILLLNVLVYLPVRRALRPTATILERLGRMESGELAVRLPACELVELQQISSVFNHLADRLQRTLESRRQLAEKLLEVREEERRHLARELHDEFGQCLTSINAEAAYARELGEEALPALTPCAEAIARTTHHMMEALQQLLQRLRPVGLEEFGLAASLGQLVADWKASARGRCDYRLTLGGELADLPDSMNVSLYRIVQEGLTNATRHGRASRVAVELNRGPAALRLEIRDNGGGAPLAQLTPGHGLLGMHERVEALGGSVTIEPAPGGGTCLRVALPLTEKAA